MNYPPTTPSHDATSTVVVANGTAPLPPLHQLHQLHELHASRSQFRVIAADGGLGRSMRSGLMPDVLVGDLDSVDAHDLAKFRDAGGRVVTFPADKNQTDLELAIDLAIDLATGPAAELPSRGSADRATEHHLIVIGGDGADRFDHLIGEITHVAHRAHEFSSVTVHYPPSIISVLTSGKTIELAGAAGSVLSLIPLGATAYGVSASGVRWPLDGDDLRAGSTRGLSNELLEDRAVISLEQGILLIIQPVVIP